MQMTLFIGTSEILLILVAALLLFGSKRIPELARSLGKGYREFQKAADELKSEINTQHNDNEDIESQTK